MLCQRSLAVLTLYRWLIYIHLCIYTDVYRGILYVFCLLTIIVYIVFCVWLFAKKFGYVPQDNCRSIKKFKTSHGKMSEAIFKISFIFLSFDLKWNLNYLNWRYGQSHQPFRIMIFHWKCSIHWKNLYKSRTCERTEHPKQKPKWIKNRPIGNQRHLLERLGVVWVPFLFASVECRILNVISHFVCESFKIPALPKFRSIKCFGRFGEFLTRNHILKKTGAILWWHLEKFFEMRMRCCL